MAEKLHDAFISYSRKDRAFASLLEKALEAFSPPKIGTISQRHLDIFRDEEDFTGTDYHKAVSKHLQDSRKLIVICTPAARASQYVNDEICLFAKTNGSEHIIPILLDGLPNNEATEQRDANKAFPDALVNCVQMPLAIDYRDFRLGSSDKVSKGKFQSVWFSLLANLYDIGRSELEQRERKRQARIRNLWIGGLGSVIVILSVSLGLAIFNWFEAEQAKGTAQQAKETATVQRDKARRSAAIAEFREAQRYYEDGYLPPALIHQAQAIKLDPSWLSSRTALISYLQRRNWHLPVSFFGNDAAIKSTAFSPDSKRMLTVSINGGAQLWDVYTNKPIGKAMKHGGAVKFAAFSPDSARVVTVSDDGTAQLWNSQTGKALGEAMKPEGGNLMAQFSPDGMRVRTISSGFSNEMMQLWNGLNHPGFSGDKMI